MNVDQPISNSMKKKLSASRRFLPALFVSLVICLMVPAAEPVTTASPKPAVQSEISSLSFGGERHNFVLEEGQDAFVILPKGGWEIARERPWIWYAPTFVHGGLPGREHEWLFSRLLQAGFSIAGVDVGESHGNTAGREIFVRFHDRIVKEFGFSSKACLLPQSRGGLMLYNWAVEHAEEVQCIGGIYTVGNLESYPGLDKASVAYGIARNELARHLSEYNPIDRLTPLARTKVPIFHIHGDADKIVPLEKNAGELVKRYQALGGIAQLVIVHGKGHEVCPEFFQSQALLDFFISHSGFKVHEIKKQQE